MTTAALQRFAELSEQKTALNAALSKVKAELKGLQDQVMEYFADAGIQSTKLESGRSVYIHRQLWAAKVDEDMSGQEIVSALQQCGLGDLGTANWSSLSAWCREQERDADGMPILPAGLTATIKVTERVEPRSRKGS